MNILCFTHADFESPGVIKDWAIARKHNLITVRPYREENIPSHFDTLDLLIVMGGPQSSLKLQEAPYLMDEVICIQEFLRAKKPVIGFCLGAQLIGAAYGAAAERSPEKEVGVFPIELTEAGIADPILSRFPKKFPAIHWHYDMPGLPSEAMVLASSAGCPRQIIRYHKNVYGFQCHFEITLKGIKDLIEFCPDDLRPSKFTQSVETMLREDYDSINSQVFTFLDHFIQLK